jgi:hypothetical protein
MAKVKIQGNASGTGILTVTAPNTSTDRTITLPDSTDTLAVNSDVTNKLPLAGGTMTGNLTVATSGVTTNTISTTSTGAYAELIIQDGNAGYSWQTRSDNAQSTGTGSFLLNDRDTSSFPIVIKEGNATDTLVLSGGNLLLGGGVAIGGTGTANTLDDYEEGTWTPTTASGWDSLTFSDTGSYTKIGNIVHVMVKVNVDGSGTGSGGIIMGGLPFASVNTGSYRPAITIFVCRLASDIDTYVSGYIDINSTTVVIREGGTTGDGGDLGPHFDSGSYFYFQATYRV